MKQFSYIKCTILSVFLSTTSITLGADSDNISQLNPSTSPDFNDSNIKAKELWSLFDYLYKNIQKQMKEGSEVGLISTILSKQCSIDWNNQSQVKALLADADHLDANNGLSVRGGYTTKDLNDNVNDDEGNAYVELSWDVLKSGYKDYGARAESIRRLAEIKKLEGELKQLTLDYRCRNYNLSSQFVGMESAMISLKLELMEPVYQVEKRAYFSGWSLLDEFLVSEQDLKLARQELGYLQSNIYSQASRAENINPPVIDVDVMAIIDAINKDKRYTKISNLEKKYITEKNDYQDGSRFRVFLRKEFASSNFDNEGVVAGLRFSVPLSFSDDTSNTYKTKQIDEEAAYAVWERISKTRTAYGKLHEQYNRVVKLQYRYLKSNERVRRIKAYQSLNQELELAAVIARMRTFLDTSLELIRAKKELYRRVNEIFLEARIEYDEKYIKVSPLKDYDYRARSGERSVYLWSKRFNSMPNGQLLSFMTAKDIKRVLLSGGKKTNREKMQQFNLDAKAEGIDVETIIGSNNWVYPSNHLKAAAAVAAMAESTSTIHLDVEPQAIKGSKEDKAANVIHYIELLTTIRKISDDVKLTVAVPFHWSPETYTRVSGLTNKIYIMAYGTNKLETIVRRVSNVLQNVPLEKTVVVLNVKDFENEWAMEQAVVVIGKATGITEFAFHQLDTFIKQQGQ